MQKPIAQYKSSPPGVALSLVIAAATSPFGPIMTKPFTDAEGFFVPAGSFT